MYPRAGHELEVLYDAAVETKAACRILPVDELHRIAGDEETFLIERLGGELGHLPIARRYVRPAHARLELVGVRHKLDFDARARRSEVADLGVVPVENEGRG